MIKVLIFLITFLNISFISHSIEEEEFIEKVDKCYETYNVILDKETSVGDVTAVFGIKDDKYYISAFFLNDTSVNMTLKFYINDVLEHTFVVEGTIINAFGVNVKKGDLVKLEVHHLSLDIHYEFEVDKLLNMELVQGKGVEDFPQNNLEKDVIKIIKLFILGFALASIALIFVIIYFYKKRKGAFSENAKTVIDVESEYYEEFGDPVEDAKKDLEQVNKQALMDRYFEEYRSGDITEEELNEKLKKLWWKDEEN